MISRIQKVESTSAAGQWHGCDEMNVVIYARPLSKANLCGTDLRGANLNRVNLQETNLSEAKLTGAQLTQADLRKAIFTGVDLQNVNFQQSNLQEVNFKAAKLIGACLMDFDFRGSNFQEAWLIRASLQRSDFSGVDFHKAKLSLADCAIANLSGADLSSASLDKAAFWRSNLRGANLKSAQCSEVDFRWADLSGANLVTASLRGANLSEANLCGATLVCANLQGANLSKANLCRADLRGAKLEGANLREADLKGANLRGADLSLCNITKANCEETILTGCRVYGMSAWDVHLIEANQTDLIITPAGQPTVKVDNIEVAQFVYLLLHNEKIRGIIDTIGAKGVLILGRFTDKRKPVLDAIKVKLRQLGFVPMMFDFEKPTQRDFTETIRTLAGFSRFIIADITNPRCAPLELQATMPDYMTPFVPIIQQDEQPFAMFQDLSQKYGDWVLDLLEYDSADNLIKHFEDAVVKPALINSEELLMKKAEAIQTRHVSDY